MGGMRSLRSLKRMASQTDRHMQPGAIACCSILDFPPMVVENRPPNSPRPQILIFLILPDFLWDTGLFSAYMTTSIFRSANKSPAYKIIHNPTETSPKPKNLLVGGYQNNNPVIGTDQNFPSIILQMFEQI